MQNNYHNEQWGYNPYPQYPPPVAPYQPVRNPGSIDLLLAIKYGFRAVFEKPLAWIGGCALALLLTGLSIAIITFSVAAAASNDQVILFGVFLICVVLLAITLLLPPVFFVLALFQIDQVPFTFQIFKERGNYWASVAACFLVFMLTFLISLPSSIASYVVEYTSIPEPATLVLLLISPISYIVTLVFSAMLVFAGFFPIDTNNRGIDAIKASWRVSLRAFWSVIGLCALLYVINIAAIFMCGIGLIITLPATALALAHAYRQSTDGNFTPH